MPSQEYRQKKAIEERLVSIDKEREDPKVSADYGFQSGSDATLRLFQKTINRIGLSCKNWKKLASTI
jgi:hypothetical protein